MKKSKELVNMYRENGVTVCRVYDLNACYYQTRRFMWYSWRECINALRRDGVIVRREFY